MKWIAKLTGDNPIFEMLCLTDNSDDFRIEKIDNEFQLTSKTFDTCQSHSEVIDLTKSYLETLNGMIFLQYGIPRAIQIGPVHRINENGKRDIFFTIEAGRYELRGFEPTIIIKKNTGETIINRPGQKILEKLTKIQTESNAKKVFRLIQNGDWDFANIYKIIEIISLEKAEKINNWVPKEKIKLLKWTANNYKAIGDKARHGVTSNDPPDKPMTLDEARAITKTLIEYYISDITRD